MQKMRQRPLRLQPRPAVSAGLEVSEKIIQLLPLEIIVQVAQGLDMILITWGHSDILPLVRGGGWSVKVSPLTKTPRTGKYSHSSAKSIQVSLLPPRLSFAV